MTRRVLITGGYGYVGGRAALELAKQGWAVTLGTRRPGHVGPTWLPQAQSSRLDWESAEQLCSACADQDALVHLAAMNENDALRDPVAALKVNGVATLQLLEAAKLARVKRVIYLSTAHVYGAPLAGTINENSLPRPIHPYAITHKVAEDFVLAAHDKGIMEGVVMRMSNGFGAPAHGVVDRWTLLVNDLCRQAVVSKKMVLQSAGLQRRDFITLGDAARAIAHALDLSKPELADGLFNLGGDAPFRVIEMAKLIVERCETTLGFCPVLHSAAVGPNEKSLDLDYSSRKLLGTGFVLKRDHASEIDDTLRLCSRVFGKSFP